MNQASNVKPQSKTQSEPLTLTLLFVDDENNILKSLKRLFRPLGYKILTAENGEQGLSLLQKHDVDLVISDMRMPVMDGATFLAQVAKNWPDIIRILLTGYADLTSTISAVNKGHIYRYISKPWEDNDVVLSVKRALEQKNLQQEKQRLQQLTRKQNEQLKTLNASLEDKVVARTGELQQTVSFLELSQKSLHDSYRSTVDLCASLIEMRESNRAGHARFIAQQATQIATQFNMDAASIQQLLYAALLRNIGKISLTDDVIHTAKNAMNNKQRSAFTKHPVIGEGILMAIEVLQDAAKLIRHQDELFDGSGYPDKLAGDAIPLGARILKVVADYHDLQEGLLNTVRLNKSEARNVLLQKRGIHYDPQIVDVFIKSLGHLTESSSVVLEQCIKSNGLQAGMVLSRDLLLKNKVLLLSRGYLIDESIIQRIHHLEESMDNDLEIYVVTN